MGDGENPDVIVVCRQRVNLGRIHAGRAVTVAVSETTMGSTSATVTPRSWRAPPLPVRRCKTFRLRTGTVTDPQACAGRRVDR